jgi:hypothetical protein
LSARHLEKKVNAVQHVLVERRHALDWIRPSLQAGQLVGPLA